MTVDWPALLPDVARRLLGEPERIEAGGATWRYRARGSLAVHVGGERRGTWRDFEADVSGGTLALVQHVAQTDKAGALHWLEAAGLIEPPNGTQPPTRRHPAAAPSIAAPTVTAPKRSKTAPLAAAILAASVPADNTPARAYLAHRWTWPPLGIGLDLPSSVRWCAVADVPPLCNLPTDSAGVVVYVFRQPDVADDDAPAVSLEAVTSTGRLTLPRWRRTYGSRTGRVFEVPVAAGGVVVLVEGERDALAVALSLTAGVVRAVGGTAGYRPTAAADRAARPVVLVPDADHAGTAAVTQLLAGLPGRSVRAPWPRPADGDPAEWLENWLTERASIREYDGHMNREAAIAAAWRDVLTAVERGERLIQVGAGTAGVSKKSAGATVMKPAPAPQRRPAGGTT